MRTIHKFPLTREEGVTTTISVRDGAMARHPGKIVLVGEQRQTPHIWIEVNAGAAESERAFVIIGTGQPAPKDGAHVGSYISSGGYMVWHVYEVTPA